MKNAREKEQLDRMQKLEKEKLCFFCGKNYIKIGASPAIFESKNWYIKKNDYPYKGTSHHYLIVPKKHVKTLSDFTENSWKELLKVITWLQKKLNLSGYSLFVRSGNIHYTGASIDHMHLHLLVGGRQKGKSRLRDNILVTLGHKK